MKYRSVKLSATIGIQNQRHLLTVAGILPDTENFILLRLRTNLCKRQRWNYSKQ